MIYQNKGEDDTHGKKIMEQGFYTASAGQRRQHHW
jgi:hypothetical protein